MAKELSKEEEKELFDRIVSAIEHNCKVYRQMGGHLDDIGDFIGKAVGSCTCVDGVDQNIWAFNKEDFISGFRHGYSLQDGTH